MNKSKIYAEIMFEKLNKMKQNEKKNIVLINKTIFFTKVKLCTKC